MLDNTLFMEPLDFESRAPESFLGKFLDFISRGQYASAAFVDTLANDANSTFMDALINAKNELISPKKRLSYSDVITHYNPQFAFEHPNATGLLGFVGDVALDPLTWLTAEGKGLTALGRARKTEEVFKALTGGTKSLNVAEDITKATKGLATSAFDLKSIEEKAGKEAAGKTKEYLQTSLFPDQAATTIQSLDKVAPIKLTVPVDWSINFKARAKAEKAVWDAVTAGETGLATGGGLKFAGQTIVPGEAVSRFLKVIGVDKLTTAVKQNKLIDDIVSLVNRDYQWAPEIKAMRKATEVAKDGIADEMKTAGLKLFTKFNSDERKIVQQVMYDVDQAQGAHFNELFKAGGETPEARQAAVDAVWEVADKRREEITTAALKGNPKEKEMRALMAEMYQGYQEVGKQLKEAGLVKYLLPNFTPRMYDLIKDPVEFLNDLPALANPFAAPGAKSRVFEGVDDAIERGLNPEMDAMVLYTKRMTESRRTLVMDRYKKALESAFPEGVPKKYAKDFKFIGDGDYPRGFSDGANSLLRFYDKGLNVFRKLATAASTAFAPRQFQQNFMQQLQVMGVRAFGAFHPSVIHDTGLLLSHGSHLFPEGSEVAAKLMNEGRIVNAYGHSQTFAEVLKDFKSTGLDSGRSIVGAESMSRNVDKELMREQSLLSRYGPEWIGLRKTLGTAANYWGWASHVENFSKTAMWLNARRLGYGVEEAADLAYKAMFDYAHGLTGFERQFARRIIPFYSFQRFAIPLVVNTLLTHPGRVKNTAAFVKEGYKQFFSAIGKASSGEKLNQSELYSLPGYLLDQHFDHFDEDRKAIFRRVANITPIEVFDIMQEGKDGKLDLLKTVQRSVMAQMAPLIRIPFELALDRSFFTDKAIAFSKDNPRAGIIGKATPEGVLANIVGLIGGGQAGLPGLAGGAALKSAIPQDVARFVMGAMGWQDGIDPKTGEQTVYLNPRLSYTATGLFPALAKAIRIERYQSPDDKWFELLGGVTTQRLDLKAVYGQKRKADTYRIQELSQEAKEAFESGRLNDYEQRKAELEALLAKLKEDYAKVNPSVIRGAIQ